MFYEPKDIPGELDDDYADFITNPERYFDNDLPESAGESVTDKHEGTETSDDFLLYKTLLLEWNETRKRILSGTDTTTDDMYVITEKFESVFNRVYNVLNNCITVYKHGGYEFWAGQTLTGLRIISTCKNNIVIDYVVFDDYHIHHFHIFEGEDSWKDLNELLGESYI